MKSHDEVLQRPQDGTAVHRPGREFEGIARRAERKLEAVRAAARLEDLRVPPANQLEKLKGDLKAFHSIRINDQWRIIFRWIDGHAYQVAIVDYH